MRVEIKKFEVHILFFILRPLKEIEKRDGKRWTAIVLLNKYALRATVGKRVIPLCS